MSNSSIDHEVVDQHDGQPAEETTQLSEVSIELPGRFTGPVMSTKEFACSVPNPCVALSLLSLAKVLRVDNPKLFLVPSEWQVERDETGRLLKVISPYPLADDSLNIYLISHYAETHNYLAIVKAEDSFLLIPPYAVTSKAVLTDEKYYSCAVETTPGVQELADDLLITIAELPSANGDTISRLAGHSSTVLFSLSAQSGVPDWYSTIRSLLTNENRSNYTAISACLRETYLPPAVSDFICGYSGELLRSHTISDLCDHVAKLPQLHRARFLADTQRISLPMAVVNRSVLFKDTIGTPLEVCDFLNGEDSMEVVLTTKSAAPNQLKEFALSDPRVYMIEPNVKVYSRGKKTPYIEASINRCTFRELKHVHTALKTKDVVPQGQTPVNVILPAEQAPPAVASVKFRM
jgi:hypothetical protein